MIKTALDVELDMLLAPEIIKHAVLMTGYQVMKHQLENGHLPSAEAAASLFVLAVGSHGGTREDIQWAVDANYVHESALRVWDEVQK